MQGSGDVDEVLLSDGQFNPELSVDSGVSG